MDGGGVLPLWRRCQQPGSGKAWLHFYLESSGLYYTLFSNTPFKTIRNRGISMFFILYVFYKDNEIFAKHLFVDNNPNFSSPKMLPFSQSHNHGLVSCWVWALCCDWTLQSRQSRRWSLSSVCGCPFRTAEHTIISIQLYSPSNCVFKSGVECDKKSWRKVEKPCGLMQMRWKYTPKGLCGN